MAEGHSLWYKHLMPPVGKLTRAGVYIQVVNYRHLRLLSRFRLRSNDLRVVTGAGHGEERSARYCIYCRNGAIDDEVHLICECTNIYVGGICLILCLTAEVLKVVSN